MDFILNKNTRGLVLNEEMFYLGNVVDFINGSTLSESFIHKEMTLAGRSE